MGSLIGVKKNPLRNFFLEFLAAEEKNENFQLNFFPAEEIGNFQIIYLKDFLIEEGNIYSCFSILIHAQFALAGTQQAYVHSLFFFFQVSVEKKILSSL